MRTAAVSALVVLAGCSGTAADCRITAPCGPVVDAAFASLQESFAQVVDRWVVEPTQYRSCMEGQAVYDVTFIDDGTHEDVEVTVARVADGRLVACTY